MQCACPVPAPAIGSILHGFSQIRLTAFDKVAFNTCPECN
jgi:hypothetical protein